MKRLIVALILAILALASLSARAEVVGRVLLAAGDAVAVRAGKALPLAPGMMIEDKDTLRTGAASNLQVRYTDASIMSLRENSELAIEEYRFSGRPDRQENAFYRLVKGGLRTVTGFIGRTRHENYRIDSVTATIGIRGTHFALMSCQAGSCLNADGSKAKDGLYGGVTDGIVAATTKSGEFRFGAGETFLASSIDSPVEKLIGPPVFLSDRLEGQKRSSSKQADSGSSGSGSEQTTAGGIAADSRANTTTGPLPQLQVVTTENLTAQGTSAVLPPANGFVVVYPYTSGDSDRVFDDKTVMTFNSLNQLTAYGSAGTFPAGALGSGSIVDAGSFALSNGQVFTYGRWAGNAAVTASNGTTYTGIPVLFGTASGLTEQGSSSSLPGSGIVAYHYKGGPKAVDFGGNLGDISSTSASINFAARTVSLSLAVNFPGIGSFGAAGFNLSGTGGKNTGAHTGDFGGTLSGTCSGAGCASTSASGFFDIGLTGDQGYGLAVAAGGFSATQAGRVVFLTSYENGSVTPAPAQTLSYAFATAANSAHFNLSQPNDTLTFSGTTLTAFNSSGGSSVFPAGSLNAGSVAETGSLTLNDGSKMNWGRWTGSTVQVIGNGNVALSNPASGVPYIYGDRTESLPVNGTFTYTYAGGPNPADSRGNVGTFNGGSLNVAFGSSGGSFTIASPLSLTMKGGENYSITTCSGGCTFATPQINATLAGTCSGGICSNGPVSASGFLGGRFTGIQATGLATAGTISTTGNTVSFAAGFTR